MTDVDVSPRSCPHCGEEFRGPAGLAKHIDHRHPDVPREVQEGEARCPECDKVMTEGSISRHRQDIHGIPRGRRRNRKRQDVEHAPRAPRPEPLPSLTADQIAAAAAGALFPSGVPHTKLRSLLQWTVQTHEFLQEVQ